MRAEYILLFVLCKVLTSEEVPGIVYIEVTDDLLAEVDERYLSVALGAGMVRNKWEGFKFQSSKLHTLASGLSPGYLRFGGTAADFLIFGESKGQLDKLKEEFLNPKPESQFYMNENDVSLLYKFAKSTGLRLLFDLNVLLRNGTAWDPKNPLRLLEFMRSGGMTDNLDLQLGNEPNSIKHHSNISLPAAQLGRDFLMLHDLVRHKLGLQTCRLVGPDVTRPHLSSQDVDLGSPSPQYLSDYLSTVKGKLDAISWHQYYVNGREATVSNFTSSLVMNMLPAQIEMIKGTIANAGYSALPVWLTETSSAWGGGSPGLTDTYADGFLWLDKLGVSARDGVAVVMRQTFYGGHYALVDNDTFFPRPSYWLSLLYKQLVGTRVLEVKVADLSDKIRLYAHCTGRLSGYSAGTVVLYGLNVHNEAITLQIGNPLQYTSIDQYLLTPDADDIKSKFVLLNGSLLKMINDSLLPILKPRRLALSENITFPAYSYGFFAISGAPFHSCTQ